MTIIKGKSNIQPFTLELNNPRLLRSNLKEWVMLRPDMRRFTVVGTVIKVLTILGVPSEALIVHYYHWPFRFF